MTSLPKRVFVSTLCTLSLLCAPAHAMLPRAKRILAIVPKTPARQFAQLPKSQQQNYKHQESSQWSTKTMALLGLAGFGATAASCADTDKKNIGTQQDDMVTLRNGTKARRARVEEVWQASQHIENKYFHGERFWLWRACVRCKETNDTSCDITSEMSWMRKDQGSSKQALEKFNDLGIAKNNYVDEETRNIILSIYHSTIDGYFSTKRYPVKKWYESIPGYGFYALITGK